MEPKIKTISKKLFTILLSFLMLLSTMLSTVPTFAEGTTEKTVTDLNLAHLMQWSFCLLMPVKSTGKR